MNQEEWIKKKAEEITLAWTKEKEEKDKEPFYLRLPRTNSSKE